jgi:hypothetical protein
MRFRSIKFILIFIISCLVFGGCRKSDWSTDPPPAEKIVVTNKVRSELGVRQIKGNWTFYGREFGTEKWKYETGSACKDVMYDRNYETILCEADYYYSGCLVSHPDPDADLVREMLQIVYDYRIKRFGIIVTTDNEDIKSMEDKLSDTTPDSSHFNVAIPGFMGRTNKEALEVADKILKIWGLERL